MAVPDVASACSAASFQLRHFHLALRVDFGQLGPGCLQGSVRLELHCLRDHAAEIVLDSHPSVQVESAGLAPPGSRGCAGRDGGTLRPLLFQDRPFASYGSALHVTLPEPLTCGDVVVLEIAYRAGGGPGISCLDSYQTAQKERPLLYTSGFPVQNRSLFPGFHTPAVKSTYSAHIQVCWLAPEQTAGKQKPFMYTQGQAVLNRSFFPCFDTPAVKSTYSAVIKVPEGFIALMSAITGEKQKDNTFVFKMTHPIPSYLVALAVGDIVSAEVGPRSHVWAEPCLIDAAEKEYSGVIEEFLTTGEKLFGPYVWERYDVLFMPPSFPFGGMENPCITFVTPCLLAGDRSLVDVMIHEISHSWFGNLVTNANWGEFWLNEGFTMYAQRRISTVIYGAAYTCLEAATGRALLRQHMDNTGEDHPLNKLRVKIEPGIDPEDTYNETPYEKGYCFVSYLAHLVGDQSKFDAFLQAYVNQFKFQSITADDALGFYLKYFPELKKRGVDTIPGFEFDRWLNTPGWPPYLPDLSSGEELMKPAEELAEMWAFTDLNMEAIKAVDISSWKTYQLVYFLDKILQKSPLPEGSVEKMSDLYPRISKAQNAELRLRWCQIVLKNDHEADFGKVKDFLHSQGKQKYTLSIYRAMKSGSETAQALAVEIFAATAPQLHVHVQNYVKKILGLKTEGN